MRWLYGDGHSCRPGDIVAYCNVGLSPLRKIPPDEVPFADEAQDFQIAFAPRIGGRLHIAQAASHGGFLDLLHNYQGWQPDFEIGRIEPSSHHPPPADDETELRLLMITGRRMTDITVDRSGLLTGWHGRRRGWWGEGGAPSTLLSMGICEQIGIMRGERGAFAELFEATAGPAHVIHIPDETLVPCAAVAADQLRRTAAESQAIAADFARSFPLGSATPSGADWLFAGALLSALSWSPLSDRHDILTRSGLRRSGPVDAVLMSIHAEPPVIFRHRRLGYHVNFHSFRIASTGPAVTAWLRANFDPVRRTSDDIRRDYRVLFDALQEHSRTHLLILNAMSSSGYDEIANYAAFDRPISDSVGTVRAKEMNLMLCDLARERDIAIVDADLVAAELGARHLPDGMHQSGRMQAMLRAEILRILHARGIAGFAPASSRRKPVYASYG
jgi:hypothetical protein